MITDEPAFAETPGREQLNRARLAELHALAAARGIEGYRLLRKDELVEAILTGAPRAEGDEYTVLSPDAAHELDRPAPFGEVEEAEPLEGEPKVSEPPYVAGDPRDSYDEPDDADADRGQSRVEGVFDPVPDGYGFLRVNGLVRTEADVYVSHSRARAGGLRKGDLVAGSARPPRRSERYPSLDQIEAVNGRARDDQEPVAFEELTAVEPVERLSLACEPGDLTIRLATLVAPIAKGQRCLIVSPPGAGATTLLRSLASAIGSSARTIVLLLDARPEEVTASQSWPGVPHVSSAEQSPDVHIKLGELAMARAKRLVEEGSDVVVLLDSLSRFANAHQIARSGAPARTDGERAEASVQAAKQWFASARNTEEAGSLTILATVRTSTGSTLDELLHPALSEVATSQLLLDERLSAYGFLPAIDVTRSYGRSTERSLVEEARRRLTGGFLGLEPVEAWKRAAELVRSTPSNDTLLAEA